MELLSNERLELSSIVANNRMNRERNAIGINSYERDILLSPIEFITHLSESKKSVAWLDICCGRGRALIQTAEHLEYYLPEHQFSLIGIDLVDMHDPIPDSCRSLAIITDSFFHFETERKFDLITCVHGLHYLGDKLGAIKKACSLLTSEGTFIANLDIHNIKNSEDKDFYKKIASWLKVNDLLYNSRRHLLQVTGNKSFDIPFQYMGADDKAGPNYTRQEVVDSYYK